MKPWLFVIPFVSIGFLCSALPGAAQSYALKGRVLEADSEIPLEGANVYSTTLQRGTATIAQGIFSMAAVPPGTHTVRVTFVGYVPLDTLVTIPQSNPLIVRLRPDPAVLEEVVVEERFLTSDLSTQAPVSTIKVSALPAREMPQLLGEPDLIRTIQTLPGVKVESDFTGGFYVRGGRSDQNLILLDGTPIYNPWHLFGLFSAFNTEAVGRVEFNKGVFPARYGSRLSSVLDVELQDGADRSGAGHLNISLVSAQGAFGTAIGKKTSLLIALRRTYLDPVFWLSDQALSSASESYVTRYNFTDANVKLVHTFNEHHQLDTGLFGNADHLRRREQFFSNGKQRDQFDGLLDWKNMTGMVRLRSQFDRWQATQQLYAVRYIANNHFTDRFFSSGTESPSSLYSSQFDQRFLDMGYRADLNYAPNDQVGLSTGAEIVAHRFEDRISNEERFRSSSAGKTPQDIVLVRGDSLQTSATEAALYATLNASIGWLSLYPGLRLQHYSNGSYTVLLPRLNVVARPLPEVALSMGYGQFAQYIHVLGNEQATLPTNRWFWADEDLAPARAHTFTLGAAYDLGNNQSVRVEGYYRSFSDLRDYSPLEVFEATNNSDLPLFSSRTIAGTGTAYGVEGFLQKNMGRSVGWLSYTLAWNKNTFEDLNLGRSFFTRTDRRHDLQISWSYALATKWQASMHFVYQSGQRMTLPVQAYMYESDPLDVDADILADPLVVVRKNNFILPAYHRLDLAISRKGISLWGLPSTLSLSIFNAYNRQNVFSINTRTVIEIQGENRVRVTPRNKYVSQLPIIPLLSLRIGLSGGEA